MNQISNTPFDALLIGQQASYTRSVTERDIQLFALVSGDRNPVHLDKAFAAGTPFGEPIAHGMLTGAFVSAALAMVLPGPGTVYLGQSLRFRKPVRISDAIRIDLEVTGLQARTRKVTLSCEAVNQRGERVASGEAEVIAPDEPMTIELVPEPRIEVQD